MPRPTRRSGLVLMHDIRDNSYHFYTPQNTLVKSISLKDTNAFAENGGYRQIADHLANETNELPVYDQLTLNYMLRANLRHSPHVQFWQGEPQQRTAEDLQKVVVMPAFMSTNQPQLNQQVRQALNERPQPQRLLIPLGIKGRDVNIARGRDANVSPPLDHMTGLVIEPGSPAKIYLFDPLGQSGYSVCYKKMVENLKNSVPGLQNAEVQYTQTPVEYNGLSCGVWTEWFLSQMAANSNMKLNDFNNHIDRMAREQSHQRLNQFIEHRYERSRNLFSLPPSEMMHAKENVAVSRQHETRAPQASNVRATERQTNLSENGWEFCGSIPLPTQQSLSYGAGQTPRYDPVKMSISRLRSQAQLQPGLYEQSNDRTSDYLIKVGHNQSISCEHFTNSPDVYPKNKEDLAGFKRGLNQMFKFAKDARGLSEIIFASPLPVNPENKMTYLKQLRIFCDEANRAGVKVTLGDGDQRFLQSLRSERNPEIDALLSKVLVKSADTRSSRTVEDAQAATHIGRRR